MYTITFTEGEVSKEKTTQIQIIPLVLYGKKCLSQISLKFDSRFQILRVKIYSPFPRTLCGKHSPHVQSYSENVPEGTSANQTEVMHSVVLVRHTPQSHLRATG